MLLIGGPPGAGKTSLGRAVAASVGWPALTIDDLAVAVRAVTTPQSHPALHPMAGLGHTRYFTESTPDKLITDAAAQSEAMWPAVERVIRAHATLKDSMVIDWWLLDPRSVAALALDNVLSVWLHIDGAALLRREAANLEFLQGSADPELMLSNFMERSLWRNELVRAEADALGLPVIHQPGGRPVTDLVDEVLLRTGLTKRLPRPEYSD